MRGDRAFFGRSVSRADRLPGSLSKWPSESRHCRTTTTTTTEEEFRVVPIARNGGLAVTILRTAGRYTDGMRDVLNACVVYYVSATKDALLSRSRRRA